MSVYAIQYFIAEPIDFTSNMHLNVIASEIQRASIDIQFGANLKVPVPHLDLA